MVSADYLKRIAAWARELSERELEVARAGITEKFYHANQVILARGDQFDYWTGVIAGLARVSIVSRRGKVTSFIAVTPGAWFGEGGMLKNEARTYDAVALRNTRLAMMDRATFSMLFDNSIKFNHFLVRQFSERLSQFVALLECSRTLEATARLARCIAWLFNPLLYPGANPHLEITQEEIGALCGLSRQNANRCLKELERQGLLRLEYGGMTIVNLEGLRRYDEDRNSLRDYGDNLRAFRRRELMVEGGSTRSGRQKSLI
jgi:CRP/FNR family transcriptional regulator, cyclic AMP receptor protein